MTFFVWFIASILNHHSFDAWAMQKKTAPLVRQGEIDLRDWNFVDDGMVSLSGQWAFYWSRHIPPDQFGTNNINKPEVFIGVPGSWNAFEENGKKVSGHGYATYHLRVLIRPDQGPLALKLLDMATAYTLFVNGKIAATSGVPGKMSESTIPYYDPKIVSIENDSNPLDIVIHVSNYHHWQGGMWEPVLMGSEYAIKKVREKKLIVVFLLLGSIVVMGIYHLVLFGFRVRNKSTLFFGVFCLLIAVRLLFSGERYIVSIFPGISYELLMKSVYIAFYLCVPFYAMFTHQMFPNEFSSKITKGITLTGCFFSVVVLCFPSRIYTYTMPVAQILTVIGLIYGTFTIARTIAKKRQGALIFAAGTGVLFACTINDILYTRQIIETGHFVPAGLFVFIFSQSVLISRNFSTAFLLVEKQRGELLNRNQAYEEEFEKRKQAQTALEKSEKQFQSLIERALDGVCIAQEGVICYANPAFLDLVGATKQDVLGKSLLAFVHPDDQMMVMERYQKRISGEKITDRYTIRSIDKKNEIHDIELSASLAQWEGNPSILVFLRDITQQKKTQEMLIQSEKMMSVGGLAAGMAHEINNPLAGMMQSAQVVTNRLTLDLAVNDKAATSAGTTMAAIKEYAKTRKIIHSLENINKAGRNAADIVKNMLSFAKKGESQKSSHDIRRIMDKSLALARNDYNLKRDYDFRQIEIQKDFSPHLPNIMCEPVKIQQVLLNLLKNAAEAMRVGPSRTISPKIVIDISEIRKQVCVRIKDNGSGMTKEERKRCFEPFFTTKGVNKGTGLGLSVSYFIITDTHNGEMYVESSPGHGSSFVIHLPVEQIES